MNEIKWWLWLVGNIYSHGVSKEIAFYKISSSVVDRVLLAYLATLALADNISCKLVVLGEVVLFPGSAEHFAEDEMGILCMMQGMNGMFG